MCWAAMGSAGSEISRESISKIDTLPVASSFKAPGAVALRGKGLHAARGMGGQVYLQLHGHPGKKAQQTVLANVTKGKLKRKPREKLKAASLECEC
jgi:hypothetical protein